MTKYKLKKDLPTVRAGAIFRRKTDETMQIDILYHVNDQDIFIEPSIDVADINNFNEWFEEVKEFEEWKPGWEEKYKFLDDYGRVETTICYEDDRDEYRASTGNCYPADTPDEEIIKEQKLIPQAVYRLKMAAKKAWFEYGEDCDWNDEYQAKYCIAYNFNSEEFFTNSAYLVIVLGAIGLYFPTKESAQNIIDTMQDDLKLVMGIE